jgi:hypothetical protein
MRPQIPEKPLRNRKTVEQAVASRRCDAASRPSSSVERPLISNPEDSLIGQEEADVRVSEAM